MAKFHPNWSHCSLATKATEILCFCCCYAPPTPFPPWKQKQINFHFRVIILPLKRSRRLMVLSRRMWGIPTMDFFQNLTIEQIPPLNDQRPPIKFFLPLLNLTPSQPLIKLIPSQTPICLIPLQPLIKLIPPHPLIKLIPPHPHIKLIPPHPYIKLIPPHPPTNLILLLLPIKLQLAHPT